MPLVTIMCPTTGRRTSTGVEMDRRTFNALPLNRHHSFHCWLCGHEHHWSRRWAMLVEDGDRAAMAEAGRKTRSG